LLPFLVKPVKAWAERKVKKFYNQCDLVYVPSESMLVELERMGVEPSRMTLWKRGIDTTLFSPAKRNLQMMQQLTGNQNPVVLFVSRLVWEKNLEILIAVYELALQRNAAINFVVAGDGVAYEELKTKMPSATFLGTLDYEKLPVVYASSDVFLFPSISETYGNVVIEAMASGLPCVVADGGGSRDFIDQGVNGFKCDANNAEDYLERISQLLADDTLRTNIISAAREYSFTESWSRLSNRYFNDVEKLSKQKLAGIITVG
jgi:glycosyltransferase involved in cell wall biosynthesis